MADQYDPNQINPMPVVGTDWSSMASAILPAIVGLVASKGNPLAGIAGAAAGAEGIISDADRSTQYNNQLEFRAREDARQRDQLNAEKQHWERADKASLVASGLHEVQTSLAKRQLNQLDLEDKAFQEAIQNKPVEEQRIARADRAKYMEAERQRISEEPKRAGAAIVLKSLNFPNAEAFAKTGDMNQVSQAIKELAVARGKPGTPHLFSLGDTEYLYNEKTQSTVPLVTNSKAAKAMTPEQRTRIDTALLNQWKTQHPLEAKFAAESDDFTGFEKWRAESPWAKVTLDEISGDITPKQAQDQRSALVQEENRLQSAAVQAMQDAYMKAGKHQTTEGFQKYLASPDGKARLLEYKSVQESKSARRSTGQISAEVPKVEAAPGLDLPPPAAENKGRTIRDTVTGQRSRSDGTMWVPLKD